MTQTITHTEWCRRHFNLMADGGIWAVPRSGLMFQRRGDKLVLTAQLPYLDEMADAYRNGADVPKDADELREYQDADYELIREQFARAGIEVERT